MQTCQLKHYQICHYYIETKLHTVYLRLYKHICISMYNCKTAKMKLSINYKREMYAQAHLNLSTATANFKCLS